MKPGLKTSEFWLALLAALFDVLGKFGSPEVPWLALAAVSSYVLGRALVKLGR